MPYARPADLPPPPPGHLGPRPLHVHLHPSRVDPALLAGTVVVVIDALRASVTMTAALARGARAVVPALTVEDARREADRRRSVGPVLLGGERGGVLIPGFDLDNSPASYTRERVAGATLIFTTSNGTAALLHARQASEILVGSFANLSAIVERVAPDDRAVHVLCAGTREEISLDDVLPAGAMVERLASMGRTLPSDDSGRLALLASLAARGGEGVAAWMRGSRGGRNLDASGLGADVDFCSTADTLPIVPRFDAARNEIAPV